MKENDEVLNGLVNLKRVKKFYSELIKYECNFISTINSMLINNEMQIAKSKYWFDFGHLNSYFESKKRFTTERAFNSMAVSGNFLKKTSSDKAKIKSERLWFEHLPIEKKIYTPIVYNDINDDTYYVEYLKNFTLSEIFCFCDVSEANITNIIKKCFEFLDDLHSLPKTCVIADWNILKNFERRWSLLDKKVQIEFDNFLSSNEICMHELRKDFKIVQHSFQNRSVIHGDFFFEYNVRFSYRTCVIDPRGCDFRVFFLEWASYVRLYKTCTLNFRKL